MDVYEALEERDRIDFWYEYHWWQTYHNPDARRQAG